MKSAEEYIREVAWHVVTAPCWLNADLLAKLQMETRVSSCGIATLLLQYHPGKPRIWIPIASWGCCLEPLEKIESHVLLELKEKREGTWKMGKLTYFPGNLLCR